MTARGSNQSLDGIGMGRAGRPVYGGNRGANLTDRAADETLAEAGRRASMLLEEAEERAASIVASARVTAIALIGQAEATIADVLGGRTDTVMAVVAASHERILEALRSVQQELDAEAARRAGPPLVADPLAPLQLFSQPGRSSSH